MSPHSIKLSVCSFEHWKSIEAVTNSPACSDQYTPDTDDSHVYLW